MKDKGQAQKVVLRLPDGRPVTVFNVHPLRTRGWSHRYRQISALLEEDVVRERAPVILGGDFNAPDHSQLYGSIAGHLENAHRAAGSGFGFTYPASSAGTWGPLPVPALVRIDHIFFSDHFVALRAGTLEDSGGSDHHPVFAELVLK
jgi:endonuclease/exonuclease/phosphatase (EEP) superfamily protein YafD